MRQQMAGRLYSRQHNAGVMAQALSRVPSLMALCGPGDFRCAIAATQLVGQTVVDVAMAGLVGVRGSAPDRFPVSRRLDISGLIDGQRACKDARKHCSVDPRIST